MSSSTLLRNTAARRLPLTSSPSTVLRISGARQQRRCESTKPKHNLGKSSIAFKEQLMGSTTERIEKERAQMARYASQRQEWAGGRNFATSITVVGTALIAYFMGTKNPQEEKTSSTDPISSIKKPRHNTAPANLEAAWTDFVAILGEEHVATNADVVLAHAGSEWSTHIREDNEKPFLVVYPSTTEEVSQIMKVCHKRRIPVTPYSGGTSLEGHYTATRGGICVDFQRMDQILNIHERDMDVVVQPAVGWEHLNDVLKDNNLFFPPDPGPGAQIGGMIGTGCSGTNAYRYGTMREWVLSLTVVLADGTVIKTRQRPRKSSAGYDLTKMFIGSEGTLGLVTEAVLKVTPIPAATSVAVCAFPTIRHAAECVAKVVGDGIPIAAIEILDDVQMKCINASGATGRKWAEEPTLFFKFSGTDASCKEQVSMVKTIANHNSAKTFDFAKDSEEQKDLWSARKEALWSVMALKRDDSDHVWTGDVAVPISRLPDIIEETKADLSKSGLLGTIVGHVGDGNFHSILIYSDAERKKAEDVVHRMVKRAVEMEGTVTGEHGVGLVKRDYLPKELGESTVDAMRRLKMAFDPLCLLNPDKVVRIEAPKKGEVEEW